MTILEAFLTNLLITPLFLLPLWASRDEMPDSFWHTGIYYALGSVLIVGTLFRWYFQIPLLGLYSWVIG